MGSGWAQKTFKWYHGDVKSLIFICFSELFGVSVFFELADIVEPSWSHFAVILDRPWAVRKEFSGCLACVFCYLEGFWTLTVFVGQFVQSCLHLVDSPFII